MEETPGKCPSGDASAEDAVVFAVVGRSADTPLLRYLDKAIPVTRVREAGATEAAISQGMRISSNCVGARCKHYAQSQCGLATKVTAHVPAVTATLPPCAIRKECIWWNQEGVAACLRCPTVTRERRVSAPV